MKKSLVILALLAAINFANPTGQILTINTRHIIEYVQDDKRKDLTDNEILRNKVVLYARLQIIMLRVRLINNSLLYDTG